MEHLIKVEILENEATDGSQVESILREVFNSLSRLCPNTYYWKIRDYFTHWHLEEKEYKKFKFRVLNLVELDMHKITVMGYLDDYQFNVT